jgi:type II secretion system protein N
VGKQRSLLVYSTVILWGLFVITLIIYLFFPYQKVLRIALQNIVGNSRTAVSMEGVITKPLGIKANKILLQPDPIVGQRPFELTNIDITWSPFSLLFGNFSIKSIASLYEGSLQSSVNGIHFVGLSNPTILLTLEKVNMSLIPEGAIPWLRGTTGTLSGTIRKKSDPMSPNKQSGSFAFFLKEGEIKNLQVRNLPRLIIPFKEISADGKIDGSRIDLSKIHISSDVISLSGSGVIDSVDIEQSVIINLSYQTLIKTFPLKGQGNLHITGSLSSPMAVSMESKKDAIKNDQTK